jgi:ABC-type sugar transport system ATPase subunit
MIAQPLFTISGASKRYNGIPALIDASLTLNVGEVQALMGENGAGKSTLIKLLAGVLAPDDPARMVLTLRGVPITIANAQAAFKLGLRFIHQELNVVPQLSVAENIFLNQPYPRYAGLIINWRKLNAGARVVLDQLGIGHLNVHMQAARLSTGDRMLLKIASAFVGADSTNAAVYVMDEPTAALSSEETDLLFRVIRRLRDRGCTVLYVSHRIDEIFKIADRVTVMRDGRVVATHMVSETSPTHLIELMTGRDLQQIYPVRISPPTSAPLLQVTNLNSHVITGVSFTLHAGEVLGVAGLSGSGRSELLRALMGIDRSHGGEILLDGQVRLDHHSPKFAWRQGLAYVPEERRTEGLVMSRSIGDNVVLPHLGPLSRGGMVLKPRTSQRLSDQIGSSVKLKTTGQNQIVRELSGGNQQKTVFARALAWSPRVLLLDEPTRGVDVGAKYDLYHLIRDRSAQGLGIMIVSSELPELIGLCDRILIMHGGRLINTVAAEGLSEADLLTLCYGTIPQPDATAQ